MLILQCAAAGGNSLSYFTTQPQSAHFVQVRRRERKTVCCCNNQGFMLLQEICAHRHCMKRGSTHLGHEASGAKFIIFISLNPPHLLFIKCLKSDDIFEEMDNKDEA